MHGPGLPPQHGHQPTTGGVVALRVLFTLLPILTCGFFAWGTMLRLALLTRKAHDWVLLVVSGVLSVSFLVLVGMDPTEDTSGWQGNLGMGGSLFTGFAICVYYLVADIKHYEAKSAAQRAHWYPAQQPAPYVPPQPQPQPPVQGYGYPPAQQQAPAHPPMPPQPQPQPQTQPRIGQVRAELDELSELLRNQPPRDQTSPDGDTNR
ncbi:hypothetical protein [Streptomyces sp. NBC_01408]|uniref:hypothetical protein n=1 Tax=Streptomyces sp. NBC_01408 TaxID=2903855 RepID=UPI002254DAE0|nr:hypothetical protein [Streptomyces sp. NBC_01408]MCX4692951.1 hypothetical protein [Streptomyces sp. NBC_01408]